MKAALISLALMLAPGAALAAAPPELIGDWKGVLEVEGAKLTLVFHVSADRVVVDSPDQGSFNLPGSYGVNGSAQVLGIPMVGATFEGKVSADGKTMAGTFYQGGNSPALTLNHISNTPTLPPPAKPAPAAIKGEWEGKLQSPGGTITFNYHLTDNPNADIDAANAKGVPAMIDAAGDGYKIDVMGAVFTGKLAADGKTMAGTITQNGQGGPMTLTRK